MILSKLLPDNLPIVTSTIFENLGFIYHEFNGPQEFFHNKRGHEKSFYNTFYKLIYITTGQVSVEHGLNKKTVLNQPSIYFSAPGKMHEDMVVSDDFKGHILLISKEILVDILNKLPDSRVNFRDETFILTLSDIVIANDKISILQDSFTNIAKELKKDESLGLRALLLCWIRLAYITAFRSAHEGSTIFITHHHNTTKFRRYLSLIDEYHHEHWSLSQYAKKLHITVPTLNNICKEFGGRTAKQFITQRVLKEAEFNLRYTDLTIIEIAYLLGFKDSSYFARFFRRYADLSPKEYRESLLVS